MNTEKASILRAIQKQIQVEKRKTLSGPTMAQRIYVIFALIVISSVTLVYAGFVNDRHSGKALSAISTGSATNISQTSATVNGTVSPLGVVERGFAYGADTNYGTNVTDTGPLAYTYLGQWGSTGNGSNQFSSPKGITISPQDYVYVVDQSNNRVQKFNANGTFQQAFGTYGTADGQFSGPTSVTANNNSDIYITDTVNHRIQKFDSNGNFITKWGVAGSGDGEFQFPAGLASDSSGNIYVTDTLNNRIQKFDSNGNFITKWGVAGSGDGEFSQPVDIAADSNNDILVSDGSNRIQKFDSNGNFITKWGSTGTGDGAFQYPYGISTDAQNNVYIVDSYNNRIQKFDSNGNFITKWGVAGSGDGALSFPRNLVVRPTDATVYLADSGNDRVQVFSGSITAEIQGLSCETTYHYRAYATNGMSTTYGEDATFTTANCVTNLEDPQNLTANPRAKSVELDWGDVSAVDYYKIEYKPSSESTWLTANNSYSSSAIISGLTSETSYDFRIAAASNSLNTQSNWVAITTSTIAQQTYHITNCVELQSIALNPYTFEPGDMAGKYILDNDIDCSESASWTWEGLIPPQYQGIMSGFIAIIDIFNGGPFVGDFDGQGHTISNMHQQVATGGGLFAVTSGSVLQDVTLNNSDINNIVGVPFVGGFVTRATNSTISKVNVTGLNLTSITGATGGVAGGVEGTTTITQSRATGSIDAQNSGTGNETVISGGLVGGAGFGATPLSITESYADVDINIAITSNGSNIGVMAGGLTGGTPQGYAIINDSYSIGSINIDATDEITGGLLVGGLSGSMVTVSNSYAATPITILSNGFGQSTEIAIGGLIGFNPDVNLQNSFATGSISVDDSLLNPGGLVGVIQVNPDYAGSISIANSYYNQGVSGAATCVNRFLNDNGNSDITPAPSVDCAAVNTGGSQSNYFINNQSNPPLDVWNFDTIWKTNTATPPTFIGSAPPSQSAPGVPRNLTANNPSNTTLDISWLTPTSTGNSPITDYIIQYKLTSSGTWLTFNDGVNTSLGVTLAGLTVDKNYDIRVAAINAVGQGPYTTPITAGTLSPPSAVQNLAGNETGPTSIDLTWDAPSSDGGSAITDYVVQYKLSSNAGWTAFTDGISSSTGASVSGLTDSTNYDLRVAAVNVAGQGPWATITNIPTGTLLPTAPRNLVATPYQYTHPQIGPTIYALPNLSWQPPITGSPFTDYVVEYRLTGETNWREYSDGTSASNQLDFDFGFSNFDFLDSNNNSPEQTALIDELLQAMMLGQSYEFRVAAVNSNGQGPFSDPANFTPSFTADDCSLLHWVLQTLGTGSPSANLNPHFLLVQDIDCSDTISWNNGAGWEPVGSDPAYFFIGQLDGRGHSVSNMFIDDSENLPVGMFGVLQNAQVSNLNLVNSSVSGRIYIYADGGDSGSRVGALAGIAYSNTSISNVIASGSVYSDWSGGGIIGYTQASEADVTISNTTSHVNVSAAKEGFGGGPVGGIIGDVYGGDSSLGRFYGDKFAIDSQGYTYVVDPTWSGHKILKFNPGGRLVQSWGNTGSGDDEFSTYGPSEIVIDSQDNLYLLDNGVKKFSNSGQFIAKYNYSGSSLNIDRDDNLYLTGATEYFYNGTPLAIQKVSSSGNLLASFFSMNDVPGHEDAQIGKVAVAPSGNIYVSEVYSDLVRRYSPSGNFLGSFTTSNGNTSEMIIADDNRLYTISNGNIYQYDLLGNQQLSIPYSTADYLATDDLSNLYVSSSYSHSVTKYASDGTELGQLEPGYGQGQVLSPSKLVIAGNTLHVRSTNTYSGAVIKHFDSSSLVYTGKVDGLDDDNPYKTLIASSGADGDLDAKWVGGLVGYVLGAYIDDPLETPGLVIEDSSSQNAINTACHFAGGLLGSTNVGTLITGSHAQGNIACEGGSFLDIYDSSYTQVSAGGLVGRQNGTSLLRINDSSFTGEIDAAPHNSLANTVSAGGLVGYSEVWIPYIDPADLDPQSYLGTKGIVINGGSVSANVHAAVGKRGGGGGGLAGITDVLAVDSSVIHGSVSVDQLDSPNTNGTSYYAGGGAATAKVADIQSTTADNTINLTASTGRTYLYAGGLLGMGTTFQAFDAVGRSGSIAVRGRADIPSPSVDSAIFAGGLAGEAISYEALNVTNSTSASSISIEGIRGGNNVLYGNRNGAAGGLFGIAQSNTSLTVSNSSTSGNITNSSGLTNPPPEASFLSAASLGGLIGSFSGSVNYYATQTGKLNIFDSHSSANVSGPSYSLGGAYMSFNGGAGGLVGYFAAMGGSIERSFATGNATSTNAGGLIGTGISGSMDTIFTIKNTYATGQVTGQSLIATADLNGPPTNIGFAGVAGGLLGNSWGINLEDSYASGQVRASEAVDQVGFNSNTSFLGAFGGKNGVAGGLIGRFTQNFYAGSPPNFIVDNSYITNSFAATTVSGPSSSYRGAIVGEFIDFLNLYSIFTDQYTINPDDFITPEMSLVGNYYDASRSQATPCGTELYIASYDPPETEGGMPTNIVDAHSNVANCTPVNSDGLQPNYFINNATNPPLDKWNFVSIWKTNYNNYPDFVGSITPPPPSGPGATTGPAPTTTPTNPPSAPTTTSNTPSPSESTLTSPNASGSGKAGQQQPSKSPESNLGAGDTGTLLDRLRRSIGSLSPGILYAPGSLIILLIALAIFYAYQSWREYQLQKKLEDLLKRYRVTQRLRSDFVNLTSHYLNTPVQIMRSGVELAQTQIPAMRPTVIALAASLEIMSEDLNQLLHSSQASSQTSHTLQELDNQDVRHLLKRTGVWLPIVSTTLLMLAFEIILLTVGNIGFNPYTVGVFISLLVFASAMVAFTYRARWRLKTLTQRSKSALDYERGLDAERMRFITTAAHELQSHIAALRIPAERLISTGKVPAFANGLAMMNQTASKLEQIQTLSNLPADNPPTAMKPWLDKHVPTLKQFAESQQLTFSSRIDPNVAVNLDVPALAQLVSSLVGNAVKFTKAGGSVSLQLMQKAHTVQLVVQDTGIGIEKDKLEQLMQPFSRGTDVLTFDYEGIGLSLYIDRLIAERIGGTMQIASKVGRGTIVTVELPGAGE
ncbi:MAG: fibronectin type III domain-containing protein [Candidatus Saccharibacteria bacterium]